MTDLPRGVLAALVTPLTDELEPDRATLIAHARWLLAHGCTGLVALATAGEANSLSLEQRLWIIEALAGSGIAMPRVIIGGGSCALDEAVTLTKAIAACGAAGALLLPPFYYREASADGIFAFYAALIERTGAPNLRLVLHHRPQASGALITEALIHRLTARFGSVIAGVQNGAGDWPTTRALLRDFPDLAIFSGTERFLAQTLRGGGHGAISATLNLTAPLAGAIFAHWQSADVDTLQEELTALRLVFDDFPTPLAQKEMLAQLTGQTRWRRVLPPLLPLSPAQAHGLKNRLEGLGAWQKIAALQQQ